MSEIVELLNSQARLLARTDRAERFPLPPGERLTLRGGAELVRSARRPYAYYLILRVGTTDPLRRTPPAQTPKG